MIGGAVDIAATFGNGPNVGGPAGVLPSVFAIGDHLVVHHVTAIDHAGIESLAVTGTFIYTPPAGTAVLFR